MKRRLNHALDRADLNVAIGGIDFSLNEDQEGQYQPFWCPHFHLITSTPDRKILSKKIRYSFSSSKEIPKPVYIENFENDAYARSYMLKMNFYRRIGYNEVKAHRSGTSRNARGDKLRSAERAELFIYLDHIGLAARVVFRGARPVVCGPRVKIIECRY
jgi:hypothetical protein